MKTFVIIVFQFEIKLLPDFLQVRLERKALFGLKPSYSHLQKELDLICECIIRL